MDLSSASFEFDADAVTSVADAEVDGCVFRRDRSNVARSCCNSSACSVADRISSRIDANGADADAEAEVAAEEAGSEGGGTLEETPLALETDSNGTPASGADP